MQTWTLAKVYNLAGRVAAIESRCKLLCGDSAATAEQLSKSRALKPSLIRLMAVALWAALFAAITFIGAGCATPGGGRAVFIVETNLVTQAQPASWATNAGVAIPATWTTNTVTNLAVVPHPQITQTLETIRAVNDLMPPSPEKHWIELGLGALSAGLFWFARGKTLAAQKNDALLRTVIHGVEVAQNPVVKEVIASTSRSLGTARELDEKVQQMTR